MIDLPENWRPFIVPTAGMLNRVPDVRWDRCLAYNDTLRIYGWVDRDDGRADFVLVDLKLIDVGGEAMASTSIITSSPTLSHTIGEALGLSKDDHVDCLRVEEVFGGMVNNAIKLEAADE